LILRSRLDPDGVALAEAVAVPGCFRIGVSFIPQMGQLPGLFWMTAGCMPQV